MDMHVTILATIAKQPFKSSHSSPGKNRQNYFPLTGIILTWLTVAES